MRAVLAWLTWVGLLFGLWVALVGGTNWGEEIAGLAAAVIGATAAEVVRRQGLLSYRVPVALLRFLPAQFLGAVRDFVLLQAVLVRALATWTFPRGAFRVHDRDTGGDSAQGRGIRAFAGWAGSLAPNTVIVHVDRTDGVLLEHHLLPEKASEDPLA